MQNFFVVSKISPTVSPFQCFFPMSKIVTRYVLQKIFAAVLLVLMAVNVGWSHQTCPDNKTEEGVVRQLTRSYVDRHKLPTDNGTGVTIRLNVQSISSLDEISSSFEIDMFYRQIWRDARLSFKHITKCYTNITLGTKFLNEIWKPRICVMNSKRAVVHNSPTENLFAVLDSDGTIWVKYRMLVQGPCNLDLRNFPFDTQVCALTFESTSYNAEMVILEWFDHEPITMPEHVGLPDFDLTGWSTENTRVEYPNGLFDRLTVKLTFKRKFGFYILQAYIPTYLTIMTSWVSFCMDPRALPARATVGVSPLLALTLQFGNILKSLPRVSYIKAMDVWMLGCISFAFASIMQLAFVCRATNVHLTRRERKANRAALQKTNSCRQRRNEEEHIGDTIYFVANPPNPTVKTTMIKKMSVASLKQVEKVAEKIVEKRCCLLTPEQIDRGSLIVFPVAFFIFNALYWSHYTVDSWNVWS